MQQEILTGKKYIICRFQIWLDTREFIQEPDLLNAKSVINNLLLGQTWSNIDRLILTNKQGIALTANTVTTSLSFTTLAWRNTFKNTILVRRHRFMILNRSMRIPMISQTINCQIKSRPTNSITWIITKKLWLTCRNSFNH